MIYFAQPLDGGPIKIGHNQDVPTRLAQLEAPYGRPLALLATLPGDRAEEQAIHRRLAHLRLDRRGSRGTRPEQFRPAADLDGVAPAAAEMNCCRRLATDRRPAPRQPDPGQEATEPATSSGRPRPRREGVVGLDLQAQVDRRRIGDLEVGPADRALQRTTGGPVGGPQRLAATAIKKNWHQNRPLVSPTIWHVRPLSRLLNGPIERSNDRDLRHLRNYTFRKFRRRNPKSRKSECAKVGDSQDWRILP